jgi:RsiW-degrading membrane proteinase PrsW (M82 family)
MTTGFIALNIFFLVALTFAFLPGLLRKIKLRQISFRSFLRRPKTEYGMYYVYLFTLVCIIMVCTTNSFDKSRNPDEVIRYAEKEELFDHQYWAYNKKLQQYKYDYRSVYFLHLAHHASEAEPRFWEQTEAFNDIDVTAGWQYQEMTKSPVRMERELGYFGGAVVQCVYYKNGEEAVKLLDQLAIKNKPFVNCLYGLAATDTKARKQYLKKEMALGNGCKKEAVQFFAKLCYNEHDYEGFDAIYANPELLSYAAPYIKMEYAFETMHWFDFFAFDAERVFSGTTAFVGFGALVILFIWMFFLYGIDLFEKGNRKEMLLAFGLGLLSLPFSSFLYSVLHALFDVNLNGEVLNDFFYCVCCIGGVEELAKILPFLLILRFTKAVKEPVDYLFYAGISALVFSLLEDIMYFNNGSATKIYSRGIFTSVSHIADTSFIAYAMVIARYRTRKHAVLLFAAGFVFACLAHGIYDFFILNETVNVWIIPFLILMLQVWCFVHIINNCLNISPFFHDSVRLNTSNLGIVISGGLFSLIVLVYVHTAQTVSGQYATMDFFRALIFYSYLLFFFRVCINRIDVFPGEWNYFSLRYFVDPKVFFAGINHHYSTLPGKRIRLVPYGKYTQHLLSVLPLHTRISKRVRVGSYNGWFVCGLAFPLVIQGKFHQQIFIRTKGNKEPIDRERRQLVGVYGLRNPGIAEDGITSKDLVLLDWVFLYLLE